VVDQVRRVAKDREAFPVAAQLHARASSALRDGARLDRRNEHSGE
jgi:hypothetical protein